MAWELKLAKVDVLVVINTIILYAIVQRIEVLAYPAMYVGIRIFSGYYSIEKMNERGEEFWFRERIFFWFADDDKKKQYYTSLKDWKNEYTQKTAGAVTILVGIFAVVAFLRNYFYFDPFLTLTLALVVWTVYYLSIAIKLHTVNSVVSCLYGEQTYDDNEKWKEERDIALYLLSKMKQLSVKFPKLQVPAILTDTKDVEEFSKDILPKIETEISTEAQAKLGEPVEVELRSPQGKESALAHFVKIWIRSGRILLYRYDKLKNSSVLVEIEKPRFRLKFVPPAVSIEPELAIIRMQKPMKESWEKSQKD